MNNNHVIQCDVKSCVFQESNQCNAQAIKITCNNVIQPKTDYETCCMTFRSKEI